MIVIEKSMGSWTLKIERRFSTRKIGSITIQGDDAKGWRMVVQLKFWFLRKFGEHSSYKVLDRHINLGWGSQDFLFKYAYNVYGDSPQSLISYAEEVKQQISLAAEAVGRNSIYRKTSLKHTWG